MFKVIVAGGRDFTNYDLLKSTLDKLFSQKTDIEIVSGMARGADTLAVQYAS
jgi:predicted Rossmann fold nucleotide-binding protein DprA/Smf involved in DNA uptake